MSESQQIQEAEVKERNEIVEEVQNVEVEKDDKEEQKQNVEVDAQQIQNQMDIIKQEIEAEDTEMISDILDLDKLEKEYENNPGFLTKIQWVKQRFPHFRRVRRDGSCFYRALLYTLLEQIVLYGDQNLLKSLTEIIEKSNQDLISIGYQNFSIEDFYELMKSKLKLVESEYFTPEQLSSFFDDKETANALNMYLRMLTSGYIRTNAKLFENFADFDLYGGVEGFCCFEVDPLDKDADQVALILFQLFFSSKLLLSPPTQKFEFILLIANYFQIA